MLGLRLVSGIVYGVLRVRICFELGCRFNSIGFKVGLSWFVLVLEFASGLFSFGSALV